MSRETIKDAVINFLEEKNFKYLKPLGEGGFASVIAVLSPHEEVVAVKIIEKENVCLIEDQIWPLLSHRNILPVLDVLSMDKPDVKLYLTPMLPKALDETIYNDQFRFDPNGLTKLKFWMKDILLALDYLHSSGFCHCDLKTDNVLIDQEDTAVLCDFSGLNYTGKSLTDSDIISPFIFRPPECFNSVASEKVQGVPYDMYTFGLMALNMLTGHWPQMEWMKYTDENFAWSSHVWPVLKKVLRKQNFEYLMKNSMPGSKISERDINQAFDFILSMLKIRPEERPSAHVIMKHPFLKMGGNPFRSGKENDLPSQGDSVHINPFQEFDYIHVNGNKENNVQQVKIAEIGLDEVKLTTHGVQHGIVKNSYLLPKEKTAVESKIDGLKIMSEEKFSKASGRYLLPSAQLFVKPSSTDKLVCLLENVSLKKMKKKKSHYLKKNIKERMTNWFIKKFKK